MPGWARWASVGAARTAHAGAMSTRQALVHTPPAQERTQLTAGDGEPYFTTGAVAEKTAGAADMYCTTGDGAAYVAHRRETDDLPAGRYTPMTSNVLAGKRLTRAHIQDPRDGALVYDENL